MERPAVISISRGWTLEQVAELWRMCPQCGGWVLKVLSTCPRMRWVGDVEETCGYSFSGRHE